MSKTLVWFLLLASWPVAAQSRLNRVIELLEKGTPPLGIFASNISVRGGAAVSSSAVDFVIIDLEHSPYDPTRLESYLLGMIDKRRIHEKGALQPAVAPIVRLPANGRERVEYMMKQVLDLGAFGVVVPHVRNREDALAAVRGMRFPQRDGARDAEPEGHRGVGYGWAARYWGLAAPEYVAKADLWPLDPAGELVLWCMIESREGVEHALEIASTPGVSGIFIGPSDLSMSLGVTESDPKTEAAIQKILAACKQVRTPCGTLTSGQAVKTRLDEGFQFLAVGGDSGLSGGVERGLEIGRAKR
ncbi:MAG: HpcH/HpaI aldolase family protein [Bryobacteraceae bacterium]